MGLDMYLSANRYISGWPHDENEERACYQAITKAIGMEGFRCEGSPHLVVHLNVAYWRKANAIHGWFVKNCQNGTDDCQHSSVEREQLKELLALCKNILETKDATLLPPTPGFFFGSTEVNEWYWEDLKLTVAKLQGILGNPSFKGWDFEYHSSW